MSDKIISRWTIVSKPYDREDRKTDRKYVDAVCSCGTKRSVVYKNIIYKNSLSCGCLQKETASYYGGLNKKAVGVQAKTAKFNAYKKGARERNLEWKLSRDYFLDIVTKPCYYCNCRYGNVERSRHNNGDFEYTGIDRLDNKKGYTLENSVPCCKFCNLAKSTYTADYFIEMCKKVAKNNEVK